MWWLMVVIYFRFVVKYLLRVQFILDIYHLSPSPTTTVRHIHIRSQWGEVQFSFPSLPGPN